MGRWESRAKLFGLDRRELMYLFQGLDMRLTDVGSDHDVADRLRR